MAKKNRNRKSTAEAKTQRPKLSAVNQADTDQKEKVDPAPFSIKPQRKNRFMLGFSIFLLIIWFVFLLTIAALN